MTASPRRNTARPRSIALIPHPGGFESFVVIPEGTHVRDPATAHFPCGDCGWPTVGGTDGDEWYMVTDETWADAGLGEGFLCVGCLEKRLGRELGPSDFSAAPINTPEGGRGRPTERLLSRRGGR